MTADLSAQRAALRPRLGSWGAWSFDYAFAPSSAARDAARATEALGYGCLWFPENMESREAYVNAAVLLGATERMLVATGIANVWSRDARSSAQAARTLADASGDRFVLGIGVSHKPLVDPRGHVYQKPVAKMRSYLAEIDAAEEAGRVASDAPPIHTVIAALRAPMLRLAAEASLGAHPYLVTADHTRMARETMGPDPLLLVEHKVLLEEDPDVARAKAREGIAWYLGAENYVRNLLTLGFDEDDIANGGSDRLIDALVLWGDEESIVARLREHHAAGADHVCIHPLHDEADPLGVATLDRLAPLLDLPRS